MKRAVVLFLALLFCFALYACSYCGDSYTETIPAIPLAGLEFRDNGDGTCAVVGIGTNKDKDLKIPAYHQGKKVTTIGLGAFYKCYQLTSVTIPGTVKEIGQSAFYECSSLTSIHVPFGLKTLAKGIFYGCSSLTTVHIPEDVQCIEASAFAGCNNVEALYIQDLEAWLKIDFGGLYSGIHSNPMYGAAESTLYCNGEKIVHLVIPESVTYIEEYALAGCETLKSITVHNNVKFDSFVFNDCVGVKDIYFDGTQKEWKDLYLICQGMGSYTIHCSDGDIQK